MTMRKALVIAVLAVWAAPTPLVRAEDAPGAPRDESAPTTPSPGAEAQPLKPAVVVEDDGAEPTPDGEEPGDSGAATQPGAPGPRRSPGLFGDPMMMFVMIGGMLLLFFWMGRGKRKQEAKRREMIAALKKGDKITSIGGIIGTIVDVREDEVVVKVDENNNIRMRLARWSVRGVGEEAKTEKPEERK